MTYYQVAWEARERVVINTQSAGGSFMAQKITINFPYPHLLRVNSPKIFISLVAN